MKSLELSGSKRVNLGKRGAKDLRNEGKVPCVIYGGKENIHFTAKIFDFKKLIYTPEVYVVKVDVEGQKVDAIIQDLQFHPVTDELMHVDMVELADKPVSIYLPINITGTSRGVLAGGKLALNKRKIKVKAMPSALVDNITIDITKLRIGDSVRIKEIPAGNLTILEAPNDVVVAVKASRKSAKGSGPADEEEATEEAATEAPAEEAAAEA